MRAQLSQDSRQLLDRAYADVDPAKLLDYHTHLFGTGEGRSGCYVNERALNWQHPLQRAKFLVYLSAAQVRDEERAESQYLERLVALVRNHRGRFVILAFDEHRGGDGRVDRDRTEFYVPNDHAISVAARHPDFFVPACSIHPYRPDALAELERCAARGVRIVKWLPNSMGIDPADARCVPFYERMRDLDMLLLTHAGDEAAIEAEDNQYLGNPLRLRAALSAGVKVIATHFAGYGEGEDLDDPARPMVAAWRLLLRMMEDPRWHGLLFADISAATQANRTPEPLATLLMRFDLHARLVNGSDYPLPAVNILIRTRELESLGLISKAERRALNEIYDFNPLVFDFVLKRTLRVLDKDGREHRFAPSVFEENPALAPSRSQLPTTQGSAPNLPSGQLQASTSCEPDPGTTSSRALATTLSRE
jgi:predicted TIM-barrel fold metal-dependent hydrolase